ncbi:MAG: hypothetical protein H0W61_08410 [Bacteroidetes bacterium]|nr:hypothetical protein [Bacteroidota bacterium]
MKNSVKYHFSDFTTNNYRRLLKIARQKYQFANFTNFENSDNFILWRHDIDFSMHRALKMAQVEAEEGVQSTYFVLLHSEFYNLFEKEISNLLIQIINLGHEIGLHFDSHYYDIKTEKDLEKKLQLEKNILEEFFPAKIKCFCFHINNEFTLNCNKPSYAGLVNAFSENFQKNIPYCSDSNGFWRFKRLEDVLNDPSVKKLQVLTHPELWQDDIMSPRQRVYRCADGRAVKAKLWYDTVLKNNGRDNIDW